MPWDGPGDNPYDHPRLYDLEYADHVEDVDFYVALARRAGRVLELGAGTGRLSIAMAGAGARVVGVERSDTMRARCVERLATQAASVRERVDPQAGDFRALRAGGPYPLVVLPFNALHHCEDAAQVDALLRGVALHLEAGGTFAFDCYLPDWELYRRASGRYEHRIFADPDTGETWRSWEESSWDADRWIHTVWYVYARGRADPVRCELRLHMFAEATLRGALHRAGLRRVHDFGGFRDEPFEATGARWVGVYRLGS